jgi:hypothetical protein
LPTTCASTPRHSSCRREEPQPRSGTRARCRGGRPGKGHRSRSDRAVHWMGGSGGSTRGRAAGAQAGTSGRARVGGEATSARIKGVPSGTCPRACLGGAQIVLWHKSRGQPPMDLSRTPATLGWHARCYHLNPWGTPLGERLRWHVVRCCQQCRLPVFSGARGSLPVSTAAKPASRRRRRSPCQAATTVLHPSISMRHLFLLRTASPRRVAWPAATGRPAPHPSRRA